MKILRTPDERFRNLPGYPFTPNYLTLGELRMHYVDEGPRTGPVVLMLHGEPTWSYLYRRMIPPVAAAGCRVLAPDLIGFGKSDKPAAIGDYSYQRHVDWIAGFLRALDLQGITLFCQDWGSLIGLRVAAENPERFARIMVANGFLPTARHGVSRGFRLWRAFARWSPWFPIGRIVNSGCVVKLSPAEIAAYDAPFPSAAYKAGTRAFPRLVPTAEDDPAVPANRAAWEALGQWHKPFLCVFGRNDPVLGLADRHLIAHVPGAQGQPHDRIWGGHFVQEDRGDDLARRLIEWMGES
ncbi:MAG TPA: haloalkane dehalogenase [Nevskiales bacterium]|nr:haloalkane dehalogenase [Nevskiales bacterium]